MFNTLRMQIFESRENFRGIDSGDVFVLDAAQLDEFGQASTRTELLENVHSVSVHLISAIDVVSTHLYPIVFHNILV